MVDLLYGGKWRKWWKARDILVETARDQAQQTFWEFLQGFKIGASWHDHALFGLSISSGQPYAKLCIVRRIVAPDTIVVADVTESLRTNRHSSIRSREAPDKAYFTIL